MAQRLEVVPVLFIFYYYYLRAAINFFETCGAAMECRSPVSHHRKNGANTMDREKNIG